MPGPRSRITRSKDRVRIETAGRSKALIGGSASPGRKTGCGLKPPRPAQMQGAVGRITRSKDRVRIETTPRKHTRGDRFASPGRKTGCGLKLLPRRCCQTRWRASPGRKTGCGLKLWTYAGLKTGNPASPGRKTGCGLKHHPRHGVRRWRLGITRSKDRVRIETRNRALRPRGTAPHHPVERPGAD